MPQNIFQMKKLIFLAIVAITASCAGSKKVVYSPVGSWNYVVIGTPNGDANGVMTITQTEEGLKGTFMSSQYGESPMENLVFTAETKEITCTFYLSGIDLSLAGTFEEDTFSGTIDAGQNGAFPITGNRKISN